MKKQCAGKPDTGRFEVTGITSRGRMILAAVLTVVCSSGVYPEVTIDKCHSAAEKNYPLAGRYGLIELSERFSLENAAREYLPRLSLSGKATYQSDTTSIPFKMPGMTAEAMDKDQYLAAAEVSQLLWDGGAVAAGRKSVRAQAEAEKKKNDTEIYSLRERVNNLYFGILLIDEKISRNNILISELERNLNLVNAYIKSGTAARPDADAVMVEILNTEQRQVELYSMRKAYAEMLSLLTGLDISERDVLVKPGMVSEIPDLADSAGQRPEVKAFDAQAELQKSRKAAIYSTVMPRISLFMQGGYGRPGLDMLENEFSFFYIGGIRIVWNLDSFYTMKNSIAQIETDMESVSLQKEAFILNTKMQLSRAENEIDKIRMLLEKNDEIIRLRENIKKASEEKVRNGTLSVSELLRDIHSYDAAVQEKAMNRIQLVMAAYDLKYILNSWPETQAGLQGEKK